MTSVSRVTTGDRRAYKDEVRPHVAEIRRLVEDAGLGPARMLDDGTVVVHSDHPGYREVVWLAIKLAEVVGLYVHVITDDVPGAAGAQPM